jgi:hypothetical protein
MSQYVLSHGQLCAALTRRRLQKNLKLADNDKRGQKKSKLVEERSTRKRLPQCH